MDKCWQHYAKWKKWGTKGCVVYDSINTKCPELAKSRETEYRLVVTRGQKEEWGVTAHGILSEETETLRKWTVVKTAQLCKHTKSNELSTLRD